MGKNLDIPGNLIILLPIGVCNTMLPLIDIPRE